MLRKNRLKNRSVLRVGVDKRLGDFALDVSVQSLFNAVKPFVVGANEAQNIGGKHVVGVVAFRLVAEAQAHGVTFFANQHANRLVFGLLKSTLNPRKAAADCDVFKDVLFGLADERSQVLCQLRGIFDVIGVDEQRFRHGAYGKFAPVPVDDCAARRLNGIIVPDLPTHPFGKLTALHELQPAVSEDDDAHKPKQNHNEPRDSPLNKRAIFFHLVSFPIAKITVTIAQAVEFQTASAKSLKAAKLCAESLLALSVSITCAAMSNTSTPNDINQNTANISATILTPVSVEKFIAAAQDTLNAIIAVAIVIRYGYSRGFGKMSWNINNNTTTAKAYDKSPAGMPTDSRMMTALHCARGMFLSNVSLSRPSIATSSFSAA